MCLINVNEELEQLYKDGFKSLDSNKYDGNYTPTNPLLISVPDKYDSKLKVMFVAQETNDWHGDFGNTIEYEIQKYKNFWIDKNSPSSKKGTLMQMFNKLENSFDKDSVSCIWNDIVKIGKSKGKGTPDAKMIEWQSEWFCIVKKEIEILKPDLVVFFTGSGKYDEFIKKALGDFSQIKVDGFKKKELSKLEFYDIDIHAYKTYHPNYLRLSGLESSIVDKLDKIVAKIKKQIES